jgi:hypothetical protein
MGEMRKAHNVLVGRPEGKKPLRTPRSRWEDRMNLKKVGWEGVD